ncbi:MAG: hypothetical protein ACFB21_05620, partial [Opitutales bacterium]
DRFEVVRNLRVRLLGDIILRIRDAYATIMGADIWATGSLPAELINFTADDTDWAAKLREGLDQFRQFVDVVQPLTNATAVLNFRATGNRAAVTLNASARGWESPQWTTGAGYLQAEGDITRDSARLDLRLEVEHLRYSNDLVPPWAEQGPSTVQARAARLRSRIRMARDAPPANDIGLAVFGLEWEGVNLDVASADMTVLPDDAIEGVQGVTGNFSLAEGTEHLHGTGFYRSGRLTVALDGRLNAPAWLKRLGLATTERLQAISQARPAPLRARVAWSEDSGFAFARGNITLPGLVDPPLHADWVETRFHVTPTFVDVFDAVIDAGAWKLRGGYWQSLENGDYRVLGRGQFHPQEVSGLVAADWWEEFWTRFDLGTKLPFVDFDLQGRFNGGRPFRWMLAHTIMEEIRYRGQPIDAVEAQALMLPVTLDVIDLRARQQDHWLRFDARSRTVPGGEDRVWLAITGESTFRLDQIGDVLGPEAEDYNWLFAQPAGARAAFAGLFYGEDSDQPEAQYLNVSAEIPGNLQLGPVGLSGLSLHARQSPGMLRLRDVSALLGEGLFTASVDLADAPEGDELRAHFTLNDARHQPLVEAFQEAEATSSEEAAEGTFDAGIIDINGRISGKIGDVRNFSGEGAITLDEANLGPIEILGSGGSSFDLDKGSSEWRLGNGYLHFPQIRLSNEQSVVKANGYLFWPERALNFRGTIAPFEGVSVPVISQVLNTVGRLSQVIDVQLGGTTEDPKWSFSLRPIGVLTGPGEVKLPEAAPPARSPATPTER